MRTVIKGLLMAAVCLMIMGNIASAEMPDPAMEVEQYLAGEDWQAVRESIPPQAAEKMAEQGISSFSELIAMPAEELWQMVRNEVKEVLDAPVRVLLSLLGAVLLCAVVKGIGSTLGGGVHQVFGAIMTAFAVTLLIRPVMDCILSLHTVFADFSLFLTVYIPVFAGIMTTAGQPMTGAIYNVLLFGACQGVNGLLQAAFGALTRRVAGENLPLMKVNFGGDSQTYYANAGQHVTAYQLARGEVLSVEAENILAFTGDCDYNVRFLGMGVVSQKGIATSTLTGRGDSAFVAVLSDGNPLVMNNRKSRATISVDPDAVICWMGQEGDNCDPQIRTDINWKTLIGQASGESYAYEWGGNQPVTVIVQPSERKGGIRLAVD